MAFGQLQEPRLNSMSNKVEWMIALKLTHKDAQVLADLADKELTIAATKSQRVKTALDSNKFNLPGKPAMNLEPDGTKTPDPDHMLYFFKRPAVRNVRGQEIQMSPPLLYGSDGLPLTTFNRIIGSGSTGRVVFRTFVYDKQSVGVQFQLEGFQIAEVKDGSAPPPSLDAIAGNVTNNTDEISINEPDVLPPL